MTSEQSKPIALDEREVHSFFCTFGRYGPAVALGIIGLLSVFIILHRTVRGQRREKDENDVETEVRKAVKIASEEESLCYTESTENLRDRVEEVSRAQDGGVEETGEVVSLPLEGKDLDLRGAALDLDWPAVGERHSNSASHDHVRARWNTHREHVSTRAGDLRDRPVPIGYSKLVSKENLRGHDNDLKKHDAGFRDNLARHEHARNHKECAPDYDLCDHKEPLLSNFDHSVETEKKFLYTNLNSPADLNSKKTRLHVMEETTDTDHDDLNDPRQQVSRHQCEQGDVLDSVDTGSRLQTKTQGLDSSRKLEETLRLSDTDVMGMTVKSHEEILTVYQHLSERCDRLSNLYHHGSLSGHRGSDRDLPLSDSSEVKATSGISESKMKSLGSTMNQPREENYETTEISIMEATMEHNEWMNVSCVEIDKEISSPVKGLNGTARPGEEQRLEKPADSILVTIGVPEEPGTALASLEGDSASKRVAAVQPMPQMVGVSFCVHYITHAPLQLLAVTGNQQELGNWENFVPLRRAKDGFWANYITLPADSRVEWKFVLVENDTIQRWEECSNRRLQTGYEEDIHLHKWWGCA